MSCWLHVCWWPVWLRTGSTSLLLVRLCRWLRAGCTVSSLLLASVAVLVLVVWVILLLRLCLRLGLRRWLLLLLLGVLPISGDVVGSRSRRVRMLRVLILRLGLQWASILVILLRSRWLRWLLMLLICLLWVLLNSLLPVLTILRLSSLVGWLLLLLLRHWCLLLRLLAILLWLLSHLCAEWRAEGAL